MSGDASGLVDRLVDLVGASAVRTDADVLESYRFDQAPGVEAGTPLAVVAPTTREQVQEVVRAAAAAGVAVVPRGAGSGLAGGANAVDGCVVLTTERMTRVLEIDERRRLAVVEPGVITGELRAAVAERGLFYPPDPGSVGFCTIGGNVATNAGGMCCVKYGVTGDYVRALEVVLADGSVIRTGRITDKGVVGYDLTRLFVGSEGTLGIVTEVTVALVPAPHAATTVVGEFVDPAAAARAVDVVMSRPTRPSMLELVDRTTLDAIEAWRPVGIGGDTGTLLIAQSDGSDADEQATAIEQAFAEAGATEVHRSTDPEEADLLVEARRLAYPSLERLGGTILDDVCVPVSELRELLERVERIARDVDLTIGVFGHAGDGDMHPTIVFDRSDGGERERALEAFDRIVRAALDLGGTASGEHGVGRLKASYVDLELDPGAAALSRAIRAAVDPAGTLNPRAGLG